MQEHVMNLIIISTVWGIILFTSVIIGVLFCLSMIKALKQIPEEHYLFPRWFVWMLIVPFASLVFNWLMLAFGIPHAFKKAVMDNGVAVRKARNLFLLGLTSSILATAITLLDIFIRLTSNHISFLCLILLTLAYCVIFIVYWCEVVTFRRTYLNQALPVSSVS